MTERLLTAAEVVQLRPRPSRPRVEPLLPGQERVVDLDRPGADLDRALDALRRESGVDVAARAVQGCRLILDADCDPEPVAAVRTDLPLGGRDQRGRDAAAAVLAAHGDVMNFSRIRQRQVDVAERLVTVPGHEVEAIALVESREREHLRHVLHLLKREGSDHTPPERHSGEAT